MWKLTASLCLCWAALGLGYVLLLLWAMLCPLLWILRDGLGPDSMETSGWAAIRKFVPVLLIGLTVVVCLSLVHIGEWWLRRRIVAQE